VSAVALVQQNLFTSAPGSNSSLWQYLQQDAGHLQFGPLVVDSLGLLIRWLGWSIGLIVTLAAFHSAHQRLAGEYFALLMMVTAGVMLSGQANELVFLFVSLELISLPTYVLLYLGRNDAASAEATIKYFFLSLLSSALFLFGLSFLYGLTGTMLISGSPSEPGIRQLLSTVADDPSSAAWALASIAMILIFAGLGFKLAIVPFHFYAPDVYQGTSNLNAGLLAVAPKVAGVVVLIRVIGTSMPLTLTFAWQITLIMSLLTMTLGNACALWQTNLRRILAYSSIAHGGYLLIGFGAGLAGQGSDWFGGLAAMLFYTAVYTFATLGIFAGLELLDGGSDRVRTLHDLRGLARTRPALAAAISLFLFSLAGLPPLAGFWGKLTLFGQAINVWNVAAEGSSVGFWFIILAVAGALNAAVAAAYYLRMVAAMYFRAADGPPPDGGIPPVPAAAVMICAVVVLFVGVMPAPMARVAGSAERSVVRSMITTPTSAEDAGNRWLVPVQARAR
jgi:NADH-quinone oxidoreductase subunit N